MRFRLRLRGVRLFRFRWRLSDGGRWAAFRQRSLKALRERGLAPLRERGRTSGYGAAHILTSLNLVCGVGSILSTLEGRPELAAALVFAAMLLDAMDGRVARWLGASGDFGRELDSLADVVSFGTAPAVLLYQMALRDLGLVGWIVAAAFPVAGAMRLARFNIISVSGVFVGLPIPAAGGLAVGLALHGNLLDHPSLPYVLIGIAYLMISTVRYPDFKGRLNSAERRKLAPALLPVAAGAMWFLLEPRAVLFLPMAIYAASGPVIYLAGAAGLLRRLAYRH